MKIIVKVKPGSSVNKVEQLDATHYAIFTTEPAMKGRANKAVIELLAGYLKLPKSLLLIRRGKSTKHKTVEVLRNYDLFKIGLE